MTGNEHDGDSEPGRARRPGGAGAARSGRGGRGGAADREDTGHATSGWTADAKDYAGSEHAAPVDAADHGSEHGASAGAADHGSEHAASGRALDAPQLTHALLARHFWGVLTAVDGTAPYAVPVIYGWDGRAAYVLMLPGRKEQLLRAHPRACLTVVEGEDGGSVLLRGRTEWVEELTAKMHAADVVRRQMAGRRAPSVRDAARLVRARILRLVPEELFHRTRPFDLPD